MVDINEPIKGPRKSAVINPHIGGGEHCDSIPVGVPAGAVMDAEPVDYNMAHLLDRDARPIGNLNLGPPPINRLVAVQLELVLERDHHVTTENYPEWFGLDHAVPERAGLRVDRFVRRVGDGVDCAVLASQSGLAEPHGAVGELSAARRPSGIEPPACVDRVHDLLGVCRGFVRCDSIVVGTLDIAEDKGEHDMAREESREQGEAH